ncbi:MAG TPA: hypothetical protein VFM18_18720 [Methanosarcina sp.]|nr:hypothetical protein [Methanosarcina sp.]
MIAGLNAASAHLLVTGGASYYVSTCSTTAGTGQMCYSGNEVKAYDGYAWQPVSTHATISLSGPAEQALTWAIRKMHEEEILDHLCDKHPELKEARASFEGLVEIIKKLEADKALMRNDLDRSLALNNQLKTENETMKDHVKEVDHKLNTWQVLNA